ncbi:UxaA family hydrolase [Aneurinibacillus sp. REN35]|uniref:UxaA family hydrolase n=1 Tax=Aneurinibacillus sp. REN35 TaxID=3237286 RepID=UPI00352835D4
MEAIHKTVMMKPQDKVAVALGRIPAGAAVEVNCEGHTYRITISDEIDFGHKFAVVPIAKGDDIIKYGEVIGMASCDIAAGEHVHIHNLEGKRGRGDKVDTGK